MTSIQGPSRRSNTPTSNAVDLRIRRIKIERRRVDLKKKGGKRRRIKQRQRETERQKHRARQKKWRRNGGKGGGRRRQTQGYRRGRIEKQAQSSPAHVTGPTEYTEAARGLLVMRANSE